MYRHGGGGARMDSYGWVQLECIVMVRVELECIVMVGVELEWIVMVGV
jgi:hypothetical protein